MNMPKRGEPLQPIRLNLGSPPMSNVAARAKSFLSRVQWLGQYMGGPIPAIRHLVSVKMNRDVEGEARYGSSSFKFHPKDMSAIREVLADREYDFLAPVLAQYQRPVIVDAGAHIGLFALWCLNEAPNAYILSLEASERTFRTLSGNAGSRWKTIYGAAWEDAGPITFAAEGDSMGHKVSASGTVSVPGVTMQGLFDQARADTGAARLDICKIDIEGAEEAFVCAGEHLMPLIDHLVIELHPKSCDTGKVRAVLERHFTRIERHGNRLSSKPLLHCWR